MNVYKFGGASIKDAAGVRNIQSVLELTQQKSLVIVVSAMGKTTNALEDVVAAYLDSSPELDARITSVYQIIGQLLRSFLAKRLIPFLMRSPYYLDSCVLL